MTERQKRALEARDDVASRGIRKPIQCRPTALDDCTIAGRAAKLRREGQHTAAERLEAQMTPDMHAAAARAAAQESAAKVAREASRTRRACDVERASECTTRPQKAPRVERPQLSAEQEAVRQAAAATVSSTSSTTDATTAAWAAQRTMTEQLAQQARAAATEAAKNAAVLEAQACAEQERVRAACDEYVQLRCAIARFNEVFKARHGREPRSLREVTVPHRKAWERRVELRKEFPGRPWGDAGAQPMHSIGPTDPSALPSAPVPPTAAANLSMSW